MSEPKPEQTSKARIATSLMFLVCGLAYSCWAPIIPYVKARLELNDASLGLILLAFGVGALISMPLTGWAVHRFGSRRISSLAAPGMAALLVFLAGASSEISLALLLFAFGSIGGALNVSMNSQASAVQAYTTKPIISGFHCFFSLGGLIGAGSMSVLLELGFPLVITTMCLCLVMILLAIGASRFLLPSAADVRVEKTQQWQIPDSRVFVYGTMCFIMFLAEGAMLDWSALYLKSNGYAVAVAGIGYATFSIAMAVGRFSGDNLIARFGAAKLVQVGGLVSAIGLFIVVFFSHSSLGLIGFLLIGIGAANIVPIMFGAAGRLANISPSFALTIVITMGYTGMLLGPGLIGFIAEATSLSFALASVAVLLLGVSANATIINSEQHESRSLP